MKNVNTPKRICVSFRYQARSTGAVQLRRPSGLFRRRFDDGSSLTVVVTRDHGDVGDAPSAPPPFQPPTNSARPSAAEQARTIAAANNAATLATLTSDGDPWASLVAYGLLNGAPVLCVSNLAEHGRNLAANPRASLSIVTASSDADPLATGRITLAGRRHAPCRRRGRSTGGVPACGARFPVLPRVQRLQALGAPGRAGALGRWVRPDGFGHRSSNTLPRNRIR